MALRMPQTNPLDFRAHKISSQPSSVKHETDLTSHPSALVPHEIITAERRSSRLSVMISLLLLGTLKRSLVKTMKSLPASRSGISFGKCCRVHTDTGGASTTKW